MSKFKSVVYPNSERPDAKTRLFCFPYSGAGRSAYHPWIIDIHESIEPFTIQYPGHGGRSSEPLESDLNTLVIELCEALLPYCDKPFAVYAHSLGANIAYEVLSVLQERHGISPVCFFASGRPPQVSLEERKKGIRHMNNDELIEVIKEYNLTPDWIFDNQTMSDYYLPILKVDFTLYEEYFNDQGPKLNCPVYGLIGNRDSIVSIETIGQWQENTLAAYYLKEFEGDHFYFKESSRELIAFMEIEIEKYTSDN